MNKWAKRATILAATPVVLAAAAAGYLHAAYPKVSAPSDVKVEATPERVSRGKYLAEHVTVCVDCHAERDWSKFSGPPKPGTLGAGGDFFPEEAGFPGNFYAKNITPAGLKDWSDGELMRAITSGVTKDGSPMFPLMPYPSYRSLCSYDLQAIVAYVRQLEPIAKDVPASELNFPFSLIARTIPQDYVPRPCPAPGTPEEGAYLTTISACKDCHTPQERGTPLPGMEFAGGWRFPLPKGGHVSAANITPDEETGIGKWSKEQFIARFKAHAAEGGTPPVEAGSFNTLMPWSMYGGMSEHDLGAIFDHLMTQKPVSNQVARFEPPK